MQVGLEFLGKATQNASRREALFVTVNVPQTFAVPVKMELLCSSLYSLFSSHTSILHEVWDGILTLLREPNHKGVEEVLAGKSEIKFKLLTREGRKQKGGRMNVKYCQVLRKKITRGWHSLEAKSLM